MKNISSLPDGYNEILSIDLKDDKKTAIAVNAIAILITVVMLVIGGFVVPVYEVFSGLELHHLIVLVVGYVGYIILHELTHGVAMKLCGTKKIKYGFKGIYAYAGSDDYYDKKSYIFIALAPVILWGVVLGLLLPFFNDQWFWVVYFIQIGNIGGAGGDLFVTAKFSKLPEDVLIKDYGVGMKVFSKT